MARSKIGFHTGPGGNKGGLGDWERAVNDSGQAFGMKSADHYGTIYEAVQVGRERNVKNWLGFRFTRASGKISREVPDYDVEPWDDAPILCQEVIDKLPPEFDNSVWLEIINEPRDENATEADTMFEDMNATDYLGEWCLAAAKYLNDRGYKFAGPSFNAGRPGRDGHPIADAVTQYSQPGMLKYLRYCAANPEKAALALHEYSWSLWKDGQSVADWYPNLWGRFEAAIAAADLAGIPRTFHIFVTEFGFAHREAPVGSSAVAFLDARNRMTARWPQLKYDASWTLQSGWGKIDNHVNSWMQYDAKKEFDEGEQPAKTHTAFGGTLPGAAPIEPEPPVVDEKPETPVQPTEPKEPPRISELFSLDFTGWGDRDVASDPAKGPAAWYDVGNVQVPIINGRKMSYWEAEGDNRFADGESWNDFAPPEGRYLWADFLPAAEHNMLNDQGRCYHLFAPSRAAWVRYAHKVQLAPGTYRLSLDLWGDWVDYKGKKGKEKKVPKPDKRHARVELFLADQGKEDWLTPNFIDRSLLTREFQVDKVGEYDVGIGILIAFAKGSGKAANGCFLRAITLERVDTESPEPEQPEPTDVSTDDGQADKSTEFIELSTLNIPSPENAASVRLSVSNPVTGGWQVQKSYTERLEAGSRLEVAFLRETPEPTTPAKDKELERVLGMDISYAQGFEVDFKKAADAGVRFCFIRAASGKREEDPNFEHNYAHAGKAGLNRGIYYYLYPEASATIGESGDRTPEGQARHFVKLLKDDAELGAVLDVEDKDLTPGEVKRFVDEFQKHDPYKRPITIYTAAWFWNAGRGFSGPAVDWAAGHPLWVAQYTSKTKPIEPSETFQVAIPKPWKNCLIHQWTAVGGSVLGHSKEGLDLNYFLGSEDELKEWARTGIVPLSREPAVTAAKVIKTKFVTAKSGLRLRASPSSESEVLGTMSMGTAVDVFEEGDWDHIRFGGVSGYASSKHLSDERVVEFTATVPTEESPRILPTDFQFSVWPTIEKRVTQHFGERSEFYRKISENFLPAHEGIDLAAPLGTPYYCVAPGTVIKVSDQRRDGKPSAYGWHVVVNHGNGYSTLYAHAMAEKIMVAEGDRVAAGQILAHSGNTGKSSGAHLHLTLKKRGYQLAGWPKAYMDPWPMLEPLFEELRPPMGDLIEGYLYASSLDVRANGVALTKLNLNLRAGPDGESDLLAVVPRDNPVRLLSEAPEKGYYYCEVSFDKQAQPKKVREASSTKKIDLLDYIKGDGRSYEVQNARGSQERFQTQEEGLTFYLVKNAQWEQFFYDDDFIYRDIDTSPGGGRYYRQKDSDRERGSRWLRRRMAVGESYTQGRHVQFYNKKDGSPSADNSGDVTDTITLVASHKKYKFETGVEMKDVIELRWENGPEKYFYARGLGMVGWAREHEDPKTPAWSAVAEIHEKGAREPFVRETVRIR